MSSSRNRDFRRLLAFLVVILYSFALLFFNSFMMEEGSMTFTILAVCPFVVGFITVAIYARFAPINWVGAFFLPWLSCLLIMAITLIMRIEGMICWAMIFPAWAAVAGIGGFLAKQLFKGKQRPDDNEDILDGFDYDKLKISIVGLIPFALTMIEGDTFLKSKDMQAQSVIEIAGSPEEVWSQILQVDTLRAAEKSVGLANFFGFPAHEYTTLDKAAVGGKRVAYYEKGLYFNEEIVEMNEARFLRLKIDVDPTEVPPNVMDEHIVIGGEYFDLKEDRYRLKALPNGNTQVTLTSDYFIRTPINSYTQWWAKWLMDGVIEGELEALKTATEQP